LFTKLFRPAEKLFIKRCRTWQCGQRSAETLLISLINAIETPNIANMR